MNKFPSYLKGLVESRARAAGDIERLTQLRVLIDEQLAAANKKLEAADILIRDFSPLLDPTVIGPVRARKGRYGKHGNFKATVRAVLEEANGEALGTPEIALKVADRLNVKFDSLEQHREWANSSVFKELMRQTKAGDVERIQGQNRGCVTRWRLLPAGTGHAGLAGLKELTTGALREPPSQPFKPN